jgi:hypothetical protein
MLSNLEFPLYQQYVSTMKTYEKVSLTRSFGNAVNKFGHTAFWW